MWCLHEGILLRTIWRKKAFFVSNVTNPHTPPHNPAHALPRFLGCHSTDVPRNVLMPFHYPVSLHWHALTLHQLQHDSHSTTHESKQRSTASTPISKGFLQAGTDLLASCNLEMLAEIIGLANWTMEKNCDPEWWMVDSTWWGEKWSKISAPWCWNIQ